MKTQWAPSSGRRCRRPATPIRTGSRRRWSTSSRRCGLRRAGGRRRRAAARSCVATSAGASVLIVGDGDASAPFTTSAGTAAHGCARRRTGVLAGSIQCPYHGWTYGLDGRLIGAPQMDDVEGFRRDDYPLSPGRLRDVGRPCLHQSRSAIRRRWPHSSARCPRRSRRGGWRELRRVHRVMYNVQANWKLIVQNYNECLHCPIIHPLLNRMHHYLGAANVPSTDTLLRRRDGLQGRRRDVERRWTPAARPAARPERRAADTGLLLRRLSEPAPHAAPGLHGDGDDLAADARSHAARQRRGTSIPTRSRDRGSSSRTRSSSGTSPIARTGRSPSARSAASRRAATRPGLTRPRNAALGVRPLRAVARVYGVKGAKGARVPKCQGAKVPRCQGASCATVHA